MKHYDIRVDIITPSGYIINATKITQETWEYLSNLLPGLHPTTTGYLWEVRDNRPVNHYPNLSEDDLTLLHDIIGTDKDGSCLEVVAFNIHPWYAS